MPIAKQAPQPTTGITTPTIQPPDTISRLDVGGVPVDVFGFFDVSLSAEEKEVSKLKTIYDWSKIETESGTLGDILTKIRHLETYLGAPVGLEKRYNKLYNYCKMSLIMREIDKKRESLRRHF